MARTLHRGWCAVTIIVISASFTVSLAISLAVAPTFNVVVVVARYDSRAIFLCHMSPPRL